MIPRRVYPIGSWEMVWNSEEVNSGEGNIMGVKKSILERKMKRTKAELC